MPNLNRRLKALVYYVADDALTARSLHDRLTASGVDVLLVDTALLDPTSPTDGRKYPRGQQREMEVMETVRESDVILFCLSTQFNRLVTQQRETQLVLDAALQKHRGDMFVLPLRFEACAMPKPLKRWTCTDIYEESGFEKLMLALKLRADMLGAILPTHRDWQARFVVPQPVPEMRLTENEKGAGGMKKEEKASQKINPRNLLVFTAVFALVVAFAFLRIRPEAASKTTALPISALAENATQSVIIRATSRVKTQTAFSLVMVEPLTETALAGQPVSTLTPSPPPPTLAVAPLEKIIDPSGAEMVLVPQGEFVLGKDGRDVNIGPAQTLYLDAYYIDKFEVTNGSYKTCVDADACQPPRETVSPTRPSYYGNGEFVRYPVININWYMAQEYCEWRGARLPSEAEWEKAARGPDGRTFPWGDGLDCAFANYFPGDLYCVGDTSDVDSTGNVEGVYGIYGLVGNVSEWVNSLYWTYPYDATDGREDPGATGFRVVRGGSWASPSDEVTAFSRTGMDPNLFQPSRGSIGFRCVKDARLR